MKVCFVTEDFYPEFIGGQGVWGYHLVSGLQKLGCQVTVLAEKKPGRKQFWQNQGVRLLLTPFCFGNQLLLAFFEYGLFKNKLGEEYFDILHASQLSGLFFVLFKPKNVGKIIISVHNTNYDMEKKTDFGLKKLLYQPLIWLEKIVYTKADGLLFNSPNEEQALLRYYPTQAVTKAVYLGIDLPKAVKLEHTGNTVLYVGRLVKRKRVDLLIKAVKQLKNVKLVIIGQGREELALKKLAGPNVKFLGFVKDPAPFFQSADLFVTVSVAEGGFLLSALEAASYGLPLILSTSAAGFPIIEESKNGFIVSQNNPRILANQIKLVLKSSQAMGQISRKIANRFSWQKCSKETLEFYQTLVNR